MFFFNGNKGLNKNKLNYFLCLTCHKSKQCKISIYDVSFININCVNITTQLFIYFKKSCTASGGQCETLFDAYYTLTVIFTCIGFIWLIVFRRMVKNLSATPKSEWILVENKK